MDKRLTDLMHQFTEQGLSVERDTTPDGFDRLLIAFPTFSDFPDFPNYQVLVTIEVEGIFTVIVWYCCSGSVIFEFWTTDPKELITLALLKIVVCEFEPEPLALS